MSKPRRRRTRYLDVWLWRTLRPDKAFFGPVFAKETIVSGRRASTYWVRGLYALLIAGVVALFLWGQWSDMDHLGVAQRIQSMQSAGPSLAWWLICVQFGVVTLIAPALTAACISEEKSNRTLAALMTTPMNASQIVFGKLSSRMTQLVIIVLLSLPAILLLRLMGGLETRAILAGAALTLSTGFFAASVGLLLSILNKRPWSVMVLSEVITLAFLVGPIVVMILFALLTGFAGGGPPVSMRTMGILAHLSPAMALGMNVATGNGAPPPFGDPDVMWITASAAATIAGFLVSLLGVSLTRLSMRADMRGAVRPDRRVKRRRRPKPSTTPSAAGAPGEPLRASRTVGNDAVFWLEMRTRWVGNKWAAGILTVLVIGFVGWTYYTSWANDEWGSLHAILLALLGLAQMLMATVVTTARISSERQKRTWEVLLTTPIPAWHIVMGKLIAGLVRLSPIPVLLALHFVVFALIGSVRWFTTIHVLMLVVCWSVFLASTGLYWSSLFRRPITSSVVNLLTAFACWALAPMFVGMLLGGVLDMYVPETRAYQGVMALNPWYLAGESLSGGVLDSYEWAFRRDDAVPYEFLDEQLTGTQFTVLVAGSCAVVLAASAVAATAAALRVRRIPRRG